jgi:hypothetical protein
MWEKIRCHLCTIIKAAMWRGTFIYLGIYFIKQTAYSLRRKSCAYA